MAAPELSFEEWLAAGVEAGFCSEPVCATHDGLPSTDEEDQEWDRGGDPCVPAVRLLEQSFDDSGVPEVDGSGWTRTDVTEVESWADIRAQAAGIVETAARIEALSDEELLGGGS